MNGGRRCTTNLIITERFENEIADKPEILAFFQPNVPKCYLLFACASKTPKVHLSVNPLER